LYILSFNLEDMVNINFYIIALNPLYYRRSQSYIIVKLASVLELDSQF